MSKKSLIKLFGAVAAVAVAAIVAFVIFSNFDISSTLNRESVQPEKAKSVSNAVWFVENLDYTYPVNTEDTTEIDNSVSSLSSFCFDTVFLKTDYVFKKSNIVKKTEKTDYKVFDKTVEFNGKQADKLRDTVAKIKATGMNTLVVVDVMNYNSVISHIAQASGCDGIVVMNCSAYSAETVNKRLKAISATLKAYNNSAVVYAHFENDGNLSEINLDTDHLSYCMISADKRGDELLPYAEKINTLLADTSVGLVAELRCDRVCNSSYFENADELLKQIIATDNCSKLFGRAFYSLSDFIADRDKSTSAAVEYITTGLETEKTINELSFIGLNDTVTETAEEVFRFKINCSDKYTLYINDYNYGSVGNDVCDIEINLRHGENTIKIEQNGKTVTHTVVCTKTFSGDYVTFITPDALTYRNGGETLDIAVGAYHQAELFAVINNEKIKMSPVQDSYGDFVVFSCRYKLPESKKSVQNLGTLVIEATVDGTTKTYNGGNIFVNAEGEQTTQSNQQIVLPENNTQNPVQNISGASKNLTPYKYNGAEGMSPFVIVTKPTAETRPMSNNNSYYNPNYNVWPQGTVDYVVGESSYTNGDGDTFDMYDLSTGRRVVKDDVTFISMGYNMPLNKLKVVSSSADNGLKIRLSTDWCVPYSVNYYNQDYYAGYENKPFNIKNYTVSVVDFVFYYTSQSKGEFDVGNNEIVAKAEWIQEKEYSILRCYLKKQGGFYGYNAKYDENGDLVINFKQRGKSLSDMVIVVDPGHGGSDPGALGRNGTVYEANQTLNIGIYLANYLIENGATVYMTRTSNSTVELYDRRLMAEQIDPDLFVSIHLNGADNKNMSGTGTFYYTSFSKPLAQCIHNRLVNAFRTSCYANNAAMYNEVDDGTSFYPFYVTRTEHFPSVLVETGYITNDYESQFLTDPAYQQVFAYAIYCGIADYAMMK